MEKRGFSREGENDIKKEERRKLKDISDNTKVLKGSKNQSKEEER